MNSVDSTRSKFFPNTKTGTSKANDAQKTGVIGNAPTKQKYIDNYTKRDAKVDIPDAIKDFSKIKRAVDAAPERDNTEKIAQLKSQIKAGSYKVDYEGLADKILGEEFGHEPR